MVPARGAPVAKTISRSRSNCATTSGGAPTSRPVFPRISSCANPIARAAARLTNRNRPSSSRTAISSVLALRIDVSSKFCPAIAWLSTEADRFPTASWPLKLVSSSFVEGIRVHFLSRLILLISTVADSFSSAAKASGRVSARSPAGKKQIAFKRAVSVRRVIGFWAYLRASFSSLRRFGQKVRTQRFKARTGIPQAPTDLVSTITNLLPKDEKQMKI